MNRFISIFVSMFITAALLTACATSPAGTPAAGAIPAAAATPVAPAPTEAPVASGGSAIKSEAVDMTNLQTYTYKTNIFSIDIPASWNAEDKTTSSEVLVRWSDSAENAVIEIKRFFKDDELFQYEKITDKFIFGEGV